MRANPLYSQVRIGRAKRPFVMYKLRTMRPGTPDGASHEIGSSRITPVGSIVRRSKVDELPQLINVLLGQMSIVGPRPCLPSQHELVAAREALGVFAVRPGITGPAQLAGIDMSDPERLAHADAGYLSQCSLWGDFLIVLRTFTGSGSGDAAV